MDNLTAKMKKKKEKLMENQIKINIYRKSLTSQLQLNVGMVLYQNTWLC